MDIYSFLNLFGGLAFFLFGMSVMSKSLEKMAGGALENTLKKVTSKKVMSFFLGAGITIAIQSSSAMTVMLVGLVNSGIMQFSQTISIILGSNVGTTLTSWIMTLMGVDDGSFSVMSLLNPKGFSPICAFIGIAIVMFAKRDKKKEIGTILVGFSVLMYGMQFMSGSMSGLSKLPEFQSLLVAFKNPLIAVLVSTVFTGIIQSSAATVGIVQALALTGVISYEMAIPLVLGANIGTCMTALLSSIGASREAKRVVAAHIYIKIIGTIFALAALFIVDITPLADYLSLPTNAVGVAIIHTIFNVVNTFLMFPLNKFLTFIVMKTIPDKDIKGQKRVFLDERLLLTPAFAVGECKRVCDEMANLSKDTLLMSLDLVEQGYDDVKDAIIVENEKLVDKYEDKLGTYLVKLASAALSDSDSREVSKMLHCIGNFERISDHALNLSLSAKEMKDKKLNFSEKARGEMETILGALREITTLSVDVFCSNNIDEAKRIEPLEEVIDVLTAETKNRHIQRLCDNECTIELGFILTDLLNNFERVSDHCSNIAVSILELRSDHYNTHKYLSKVKHNSERFDMLFDEYKNKYTLD